MAHNCKDGTIESLGNDDDVKIALSCVGYAVKACGVFGMSWGWCDGLLVADCGVCGGVKVSLCLNHV